MNVQDFQQLKEYLKHNLSLTVEIETLPEQTIDVLTIKLEIEGDEISYQTLALPSVWQ